MARKKTSTQRVLTFIYGVFQWALSLVAAIAVANELDFYNGNIYKNIFYCALIIYCCYIINKGGKKLDKSIK